MNKIAYGFAVTVHGTEDVISKLDRSGDRAKNARPVLEKMFDVAIEEERALFNRPGKKWAPNTPSTKASKSGQPVGVETGMLRLLLTVDGAPGQKKKITDSYAIFGSSVPHAHLFDKGRPGSQPPRQLINLRAAAKKEMKELVLEFVMEPVD